MIVDDGQGQVGRDRVTFDGGGSEREGLLHGPTAVIGRGGECVAVADGPGSDVIAGDGQSAVFPGHGNRRGVTGNQLGRTPGNSAVDAQAGQRTGRPDDEGAGGPFTAARPVCTGRQIALQHLAVRAGYRAIVQAAEGDRVIGAGDGDRDRGRAAVGGGHGELLGDLLAGIEHVEGIVGGVTPDAVFTNAELAVGAHGVGLRHDGGGGGVQVAQGQRAAGGEHRVGLGERGGGAGQGGDVLAAGEGDGDGAAAAVAGGHGELLGDLLAGIKLVEGVGGGVAPGSGRVDGEATVGAGGVGLRHDGGGGGVQVGEGQHAAGGELGVGLGQVGGGAGDGRDVLAAGDVHGDSAAAAVGGGHGEDFGHALTIVQLVEGVGSGVAPDAGRVDGEAAVGAGAGLRHDGCGGGVQVGEGQGAAGGELSVGLGQVGGGAGDGRDILAAGDVHGDGGGAAVAGGDGKDFADGLAVVQLVEGAGGGVAPGAGRVDGEAAVGAGAGLRHDGGNGGVFVGEGQRAAGGEHGVGLGEGLAVAAQGGDVLRAGEGDGDGLQVCGLVCAAVCPFEGIGQHQGLALGQEIKGLAAGIKGPAEVVGRAGVGRVGGVVAQVEHGLQGFIAQRVDARERAGNNQRVHCNTDGVRQVRIRQRQGATGA